MSGENCRKELTVSESYIFSILPLGSGLPVTCISRYHLFLNLKTYSGQTYKFWQKLLDFLFPIENICSGLDRFGSFCDNGRVSL